MCSSIARKSVCYVVSCGSFQFSFIIFNVKLTLQQQVSKWCSGQRSATLALLALLLSSATTDSTSATEREKSVLHSTLLQIARTPALEAQVLKIFRNIFHRQLIGQDFLVTFFEKYLGHHGIQVSQILLYTFILYEYVRNRKLFLFI